MKRVLATFLAVAVLAGCGWRRTDRQGAGNPARQVTYLPGTPPRSTRYLLVAGDASSSVFLSEVLNLRRSLLGAGAPAGAIAVMYSLPDPFTSREKLDGWRPLVSETAGCYLATMANLRRTLAEIGADVAPGEKVFLYVTSHGDLPLSVRVQLEGANAGTRAEREALLAAIEKQPLLNDWSLGVLGSSPRSLTHREIWSLAEDAEDPSDYLFTPTTLSGILEESFSGDGLVIVLSGCYTGGFVAQPPEFRTRTIVGPGRVVLTASDWNRASFGCGTENKSTYFGRHFAALVESTGDPLRATDWSSLYRQLAEKIALEEAEEEVEPSRPRLSVDGELIGPKRGEGCGGQPKVAE